MRGRVHKRLLPWRGGEWELGSQRARPCASSPAWARPLLSTASTLGRGGGH